MSIVILCGIYLAELACYQLGIRILFEARQKTKLWMMIGILFPVVIGCLPVDEIWKSVYVTGDVLFIMLFSINGKLIDNGVQLILTTILLECIDNIFKYPCEQIVGFADEKYLNNILYFEEKCCAIICLVLFKLVKEKMTRNRKTHINSFIYIVIGMIAASMMFCLGILNQVSDYLPNSKFVLLYNILDFSIYVSIILLVIFVIYIKKTHEIMEQLLKTEKLLKESQVNYYKQALKKESDTRKYRHDMMGHLGYIQDTLALNKVNEARKYLSNVLGRFSKIINTYYVTGNEMVDTIMNYLFSMLPDNIEIVIESKVPVVFDVEDTDVCTIFSNIFQNAVEEITEHNINSPKIVITIHKGKEFVEYVVKNSISKDIDKTDINKNGLPKSHKQDKRNHGIGMLNVKETVEKNHGSFEWFQSHGYFCVSIILPVK